jgi:NADH pyrophosphatase NudC (nudix superfamily)
MQDLASVESHFRKSWEAAGGTDPMARYWVSLGIEEPDADKRRKKLESELEMLSNHFSGDWSAHYSYVTEDIEDAKEAAKEAAEIYRKYDLKNPAGYVQITTQPECPKCRNLGRFSENYCPKCGTKLTPSEDIDFEG